MKKSVKYRVFSPDRIDINHEPFYNTEEDAKTALTQFIKRYESQGYYSTIQNGERIRIPFNQIIDYCRIIKI